MYIMYICIYVSRISFARKIIISYVSSGTHKQVKV